MRTAFLVAALFGLLIVSAVAGGYMWWSMYDVPIGVNGLIALILGAVVSLALGGGLMALVFISSRRGHDDRQGRFD